MLQVDMCVACLCVDRIHEHIDLKDKSLLEEMDIISIRSLNGWFNLFSFAEKNESYNGLFWLTALFDHRSQGNTDDRWTGARYGKT